MKYGYIYDPSTREFLGSYAAQESPLEPGEFITPECFTEEPPPALSENQAAVWSGGGWEITPDFRGSLIFDQATGEAVEVASLGPIPSGFALTRPAAWHNVSQITKLQFIEWCEANNKLTTLIDLLNSDALLKFKWDAATFLEITNPLVQGAAQTLSLDAQAVFNEIMGQS
jgi:hypothetical protein